MRPPQRILLIGHSNVGDAVLASPVVEALHQRFPDAELTVMVGERAKIVYAHDGRIRHVVNLSAFGEGIGRVRMAWFVWRYRPDVLVDLRQTILPLLWRPWRALRYFWPVPRDVRSMKHRHLWRMQRQLASMFSGAGQYPGEAFRRDEARRHPTLWIAPKVEAELDRQLGRWRIDPSRPLVVMSTGGRNESRKWYPDRYAAVADRLIEELEVEVALTGEPSDAPIVDAMVEGMRHRAHNLVGLTSLAQLAALMRRAALVIAQDSGGLQVAGASGARILAVFGASDERKYGPTRDDDHVVRRRLFCTPCEQSLCRYNHECMRFISADEMFAVARDMLKTAVSNQR